MKRNMDLVRQILVELEKHPEATGPGTIGLTSDEHSAVEVAYHVMLLHEAGLIDAVDQSNSEGFDWLPVRLTWDGHEFLEASRDDGRWQRAKKVVIEKTGGLGFEAIKAVLLKWTAEGIANIPPLF